MDNEQEQLLVLCESHKAKALEMIIEKILANPNIFKFAEFLDVENVQKLGSSNKHLKALKLFAYHNYSDYKEDSEYIKLKDNQLKKLKMLSIVTMAGESKTLSYTRLRADLDIDSKADLEEILLELIYNKLINATLDERNQNVHVEWTFGRDYLYDPTSDNQFEIEKLSAWVNKMEKVESKMEALIEDLDNSLLQSKEEKKEFILQLTTDEKEDKKTRGVFEKISSAAAQMTGILK
mmetsp:Transcript_10899/g.9617  ORF Transcript_10899/g.9617 Transcript_10899/m.9617 type:complete len:236 (+) Transcript_10899:37-744(+)